MLMCIIHAATAGVHVAVHGQCHPEDQVDLRGLNGHLKPCRYLWIVLLLRATLVSVALLPLMVVLMSVAHITLEGMICAKSMSLSMI